MSLQYVAKELERNQENSKQDTLLFLGVFVAVPVLLALATEVALKAWLYREGKEAHDRRHNLLYLYDDLGEITRKTARSRRCQRCRTQFLNSLLFRPGIRETLCFHREDVYALDVLVRESGTHILYC